MNGTPFCTEEQGKILEDINRTLAQKEILSKLEEMVNAHIKMYPNRHLPCTESHYVLNESAIIKLGDRYRELYNKNPIVRISALPKKYKVEMIKDDFDYPLKEIGD